MYELAAAIYRAAGDLTQACPAESRLTPLSRLDGKENQPLKRYRTLKLKSFKDRTVAAESVMENLQTGSKTQMTVMSLNDAPVGDEAFTERALERGP